MDPRVPSDNVEVKNEEIYKRSVSKYLTRILMWRKCDVSQFDIVWRHEWLRLCINARYNSRSWQKRCSWEYFRVNFRNHSNRTVGRIKRRNNKNSDKSSISKCLGINCELDWFWNCFRYTHFIYLLNNIYLN